MFLRALLCALPLLAVESSLTAQAAEPKDRPACTGARIGQFWPEEANHDRLALGRLLKSGALEICHHGVWHYRWEPAVISYASARRDESKAQATDGGEASRGSGSSTP